MRLLQTPDLDGVSTNAENGHENVDVETIRHRVDYSVELDEAFKALLDTIGVTKLDNSDIEDNEVWKDSIEKLPVQPEP